MADVDTEIEHNEMLRNELNLLQEEILIYKKKLKESTYLEQEIKSKVIQLEEALSKEIKEKKKIIDENQNLIKENENLTLTRENLKKEKSILTSEINDLKIKLDTNEKTQKEKINKIKFLEDRMIDLSTNEQKLKVSVESLNLKVNDLETTIILLSNEKKEINRKFENDIQLVKLTHNRELENLNLNIEKEKEIIKAKFEDEIEIIKTNHSTQIESINMNNKSLNEKYMTLSPILANILYFYEESENLVSANQITFNIIVEKFTEINSNFSIIENSISEILIENDNNSNNTNNKSISLKGFKKISEDATVKDTNIEQTAKNFFKFKEKIANILNISDNILSQAFISFSDQNKIKNKIFKSIVLLILGNTNSNMNIIEDYLILIDKLNFNTIITKLNDFLGGLNNFHESFYLIFNVMVKLVKSSHDFIQTYILINTTSHNKEKNLNLEIELHKKNENYLKNAIIALNQKFADKASSIVLNKEVEQSINMFHLFSTKNSNELSSQEIYKFSKDFIEEIMSQISSFIEGKDIEIQNINEKIIYYLREIDLIKNSDKKETNTTNIQIVKLQSQLKLKEEEIVRLNQRIEEHLKNIKSLKAEVNDKINKNITFCTNNLIENSIKSSNSVLIESYVNPSNCQKEDMTSKMNIYEDEINNLKTQICEQKQNFQVFKLIIYI